MTGLLSKLASILGFTSDRAKLFFPFLTLTGEVRHKLIEHVRRLPEGDYAIIVVPIGGDASYKQHRYYRGHVCHVFAQYRADENQEPYNAKTAHEVLSSKFLPEGVESTADLTSSQFANYIGLCRAWLASFDIQTQDPDPNWRERERVA